MTTENFDLVDDSTRMINVLTDEFGITLNDLRLRHRNTFFGEIIHPSVVGSLGYAVVKPTPRPSGDVVTEIHPLETDGEYTQQWESRDFSEQEKASMLEALKTELMSRTDLFREGAIRQGVPHDFGAGINHIQVRDGDRANILGMVEQLRRAPNATQGFRTRENKFYMLTPAQIVEMSDVALQGYLEILKGVWGLQERISDATSTDELANFPVTVQEFIETNTTLNWYA